MNNSILKRQSRLLYLCATLACALSTFAFENNPDQIPPNCTLVPATGATATSGNAAAAVDNNGGSRWESESTDSQSLTVDLGSAVSINTVTIDWETANAKNYTLSGSINGTDWTVIEGFTNMAAGARTDVIDGINTTYRYLKMEGTARNTQYGYSIWEFYVCADAITATNCVPAVIESANATSGNAALAIDNDTNSRWESTFEDPQIFTVDLGATTLVNGVSISWETANAKDYTLSGSVNGSDWVVLQTLTNMAAGPRVDIFNGIDTQYRYLQMHGTARNTDYGYSIFEFDVCVPEVPVESLVCETPVSIATATASTGDGIAAIDGNMGTRWESAASDIQSLTVDMGEVDAIDFVKIYWETANAKNYTLKGSVDGTNWTLISTKTNMPTGTRTDGILVGGSYRYLKVDCTLRNTGYGYSIWEFEVCGQVSYTPVPALLQAEDWYQMNGVITEPTEDTDGGVDVGYIDANDWMDYPIDVTVAGQYTINSRVASQGAGGVIEYLLDGVSLGTIAVPNTGGWQVWQTVSLDVNLPAGDHMLRLRAVSPPFNINWIDIEANFIVWNGATWDNGTPTESVDAVINGTYSGNSFGAANLTVNTGKILNITGGNTVTVAGQLTNNGSIVVQNNGALVQPIGGTYTGAGSFTAHRNSNPLYRLDYTLWGAPVTAQQLQVFSPNTISNRFYTYAYNWNASSSPSYREQYFATNAQNNFIPGKAYLIRMPDFLTDNAN